MTGAIVEFIVWWIIGIFAVVFYKQFDDPKTGKGETNV